MRVKTIITKILAILGVVLVWFPVLAPLLASLQFFARPPAYEGPINFDYLMPAELFPIALFGAILLILAALLAGQRGRPHRRLIFWGTGAVVILLIVSQVIAVVSGLASGAVQPPNIWWDMVLAFLAGYVLGLVAVGVGGVLLLRDLFAPVRSTAHGSSA